MEQEKKKSKLKIIIPIAIVIIIILAVATFTSDKSIELTQENYSDYLEVKADILSVDDRYRYNGIESDCYGTVYLGANVKGLSNNFNYENVEIEVTFTGEVPLYTQDYEKYQSLKPVRATETQEVNEKIIVKGDISGNTKANENNKIPIKAKYKHYFYRYNVMSNLKVDIKVKGTLKPIK